MKQLFHFLSVALLMVLIMLSPNTVFAQKSTIYKGDSPSLKSMNEADIQLHVSVSKNIIGTYNLKVKVMNSADLFKPEVYDVNWFRGKELISKSWGMKGVPSGKYRVLVQKKNTNSWGEAFIILQKPQVLDHAVDDH